MLRLCVESAEAISGGGVGRRRAAQQPKARFLLANEDGILPSSVEQWLRYADARTDTSHDYDGEKAKVCLELVPEFIGDATSLFGTLSGEAWR